MEVSYTICSCCDFVLSCWCALQAQPPPCRSSRRRTVAPAAVAANVMLFSGICTDKRQQGKEQKAASVEQTAGDEGTKPEVPQDVGPEMASGLHLSTEAAAVESARPAESQDGTDQPTERKVGLGFSTTIVQCLKYKVLVFRQI